MVTRQGVIKKCELIAARITDGKMIITKDGKIIGIEAAEIRQAGRSTQGVRLVRMDEGDAVAAASVVPEAEGNGEGENGQGALPLE
jgi:DNA gyrase subunit A